MRGEASRAAPAGIGPDFVGVGIQKSGTSWVGDVLAQHPSILMRKKEISFFVHHFHRGYAWYESWFRDRGRKRAGEISVNYLLTPRPEAARKEFYPSWNPRRRLTFWRRSPSARDELRRRYPRVRVFAVFRNPVERAWSHYWFWRNRRERNGKPTVAFERMFADDGRWIRTQGNYADHLERWRETFPGFGVFLHDDIRSDPAGVARAAYRFVGVDEGFRPRLDRLVNAGSYRPMPSAIRRLLVDTYREQIRRFAALTGRDLDAWLRIDAGQSRGATS